MSKDENWTDAEDDYLREMYGQLTYSKICIDLQRSRSAVAGRVRRLKLSSPDKKRIVKPTKPVDAKALQNARAMLRRPRRPPPPVYYGTDMGRVSAYLRGDLEPLTSTMVSIVDVRADQCRRPVHTERGLLYCGQPIDDRYRPYCVSCGPYLRRP